MITMLNKKRRACHSGLEVVPFYRRFLPCVAQWLNEPDIGRLMNVCEVVTADHLLGAWRALRNDSSMRVKVFVYNQTPIGQGFLFSFDGDSCELGWYLSSKYRHAGLGLLSHKLLLLYAFHKLKVSSVSVVIGHGNISSERIIKGIGYREVGECDRGTLYRVSSGVELVLS